MVPENVLKIVLEKERERERQGEDNTSLRLSSSGYCVRKLAYLHHRIPPTDEPPDWSGYARIGRLIHDYERELIASVLPLRDMEKKVNLDVGEARIYGHVDGIIYLETPRLLEIKGVSPAAWRRLLSSGQIPDRHMLQMQAYMAATGLERAYYWAVNRDTGERWVADVPFRRSIAMEVIQKFAMVLDSTPDSLPPRPYGPLKGGKLPWECSSCPFRSLCWEGEH